VPTSTIEWLLSHHQSSYRRSSAPQRFFSSIIRALRMSRRRQARCLIRVHRHLIDGASQCEPWYCELEARKP
jgi:hypothetical protein